MGATQFSMTLFQVQVGYQCPFDVDVSLYCGHLEILNTERNMHRWCNIASGLQMMGLVVKENVRSQHREYFGFVDAPQKERIVDHDFPTL